MLYNIIDRGKKALLSKDGKILITNFSYLSLLQVAGYLFPFITIPYLSRVIGVEGIGELAFASAVVGWMQTFVDWGFASIATRDVSRCRDDLNKTSVIFSNVLWSRTLLLSVALIALAILTLFIPKFNESKGVIWATMLLLPGHILFPDWLFQAFERMKYTTIFNLIIKFLFTIGVFIFVKDKSDYILQPILQAIGFAVCGLVAMYIIVCRWKVKVLRPSLKGIKSTVKSSTDVFLANIIPNSYNSMMTILLGNKFGSHANGIFDAGTKFMNLTLGFIRILARTFFPFLSRRMDKHGTFARISIIISIVSSVLLFLLARPLIFYFYGEEFFAAIIVLRICSISVFFQTLLNVYGSTFLILAGKEKCLRNIIFWGTVGGCILGYVLITYYGVIGTAITVVLVNAYIGVMSFNKSKSKNVKV